MTTGDRIKALRKSHGMTQKELGDLIGVKKAAIQKIESGTAENIKRDSLKSIAQLFNISIDYLLGVEQGETLPEDTLAARILSQRKRLGLSQQELAEMIDASKQTISKYENGRIKNIPGERLTRLAAALQVSVAWLFNDQEAPPPTEPVAYIRKLLALPESATEDIRTMLDFLSHKYRK